MTHWLVSGLIWRPLIIWLTSINYNHHLLLIVESNSNRDPGIVASTKLCSCLLDYNFCSFRNVRIRLSSLAVILFVDSTKLCRPCAVGYQVLPFWENYISEFKFWLWYKPTFRHDASVDDRWWRIFCILCRRRDDDHHRQHVATSVIIESTKLFHIPIWFTELKRIVISSSIFKKKTPVKKNQKLSFWFQICFVLIKEQLQRNSI